jgi:hypothetical protein
MTKYPEILQALTHHCRLMTAQQIAQQWFGHTVAPTKIALQLLRRLERRRLLDLEHAMVHPPLRVETPIFEWPGETHEPDWERLAWAAQSRWNKEPRLSVIASATPVAQKLIGGPIGGRPIRQTEISHDVTLAQLWLSLRNTEPTVAASWIPEDALSGFGPNQKKPDALITVADNEIVIELAGKAYSAKRLAAIHAAYRHRHYRLY